MYKSVGTYENDCWQAHIYQFAKVYLVIYQFAKVGGLLCVDEWRHDGEGTQHVHVPAPCPISAASVPLGVTLVL